MIDSDTVYMWCQQVRKVQEMGEEDTSCKLYILVQDITAMTSVAEDIVRIPNCIPLLVNFLFLFIPLNGYSSHNNITRF